jgi:hypothetical protein
MESLLLFYKTAESDCLDDLKCDGITADKDKNEENPQVCISRIKNSGIKHPKTAGFMVILRCI